jgi:hypothetical protein
MSNLTGKSLLRNVEILFSTAVLYPFLLYFGSIIGCSFKFILKVGVEETRISSLNLTSLFALF